MKTITFVTIILMALASLSFAQNYVLEWQGPAGFDACIDDEHFLTPATFDINDDGNPDIVCLDNDTVSTTINIYDPHNGYNLIWSHQIMGDAWIVGFGNITGPTTNEMIYILEDIVNYTDSIFIMNMTTYESTQIGDDETNVCAIYDFDGDSRDEILLENWSWPPQVEIWGDGTTEAKGKSIQSPDFKLGQNYPNPFNPSTTIDYELEKPGYVEIKIFNINGQLIESLVNANKNEGCHSVLWKAKGISSGMYFYEISIDGELAETKKAIHLK